VIKSSEAVWAATDRHKHANTNAAVTTAMEEFLIFKTSATYVGEIAVKSENSYLRRNGKTKTRQRTPKPNTFCEFLREISDNNAVPQFAIQVDIC
jgi:hypothetical protein